MRLFRAADSWEEILRSERDHVSGSLSRFSLEGVSITGPELGVEAAVDVMEGEVSLIERHVVEGEEDEEEGDGLEVGEQGEEWEDSMWATRLWTIEKLEVMVGVLGTDDGSCERTNEIKKTER